MALVVNTNMASLSAQRNLTVNQSMLSRSVERLSSGLRITRASDDAAGLGVSETLRAHIRSINQAARNANDGISLTQVADGAAQSIGNLLARMRELATQSGSGTVGTTERSYLDQEFVALRSEIDRIANVTEFNGNPLLSGASNSFSVFVGFKSGSNNVLTLNLNDLGLTSIGLASVNISSAANAQSAKPGEWEKTVELAKKEGKVVVSIPASTELRAAIERSFEKRYGIDVEPLVGRAGAAPPCERPRGPPASSWG